jgi:threonine dehydrogenase-like Zn-dependent dehydrogenase
MQNKSLFSKFGKLVTKEVHKPIMGVNDILVRVAYSGFSFGTEYARIENGSIRKKLMDKKFSNKLIKKILTFDLTEIKESYRKFSNYHQSLGYSFVGVVEAKGIFVNCDINEGDIVVCGGEYANHAEYVSVPQGMCFKVNAEKPKPLHSLAFITSIPIHSVNLLEIKENQNILIYGGGLIGMLAATYIIKNKKANVYIKDKNENCIAYTLYPDSRKIENIEWDAILIASSNAVGINSIIENAKKGVKINILGEVDLAAIDKGLVEEKYASITFCNSFGYGRRIYLQEIKGNYECLDFKYTIKNNIIDALQLIDKINDCNEFNNLVKQSEIKNVKINSSNINIISYDFKGSGIC